MANQLQLSIPHCDFIDAGLNVNIHNEAGIDRDGGVLEYCRLKGTTNRQRLADIARAPEVTLTREEWYALYLAAGKSLP